MEVDANTMVITASLGVFFNIVMAIVLKCSGVITHGHSHGNLPKYFLKFYVKMNFLGYHQVCQL